MKKYFKSPKFRILLLIPVSVALTVSAKYISGFADLYFSHIYKYISIIFSRVSGLAPFSVAELIIIFVPLVVVIYIIYTVVKTVLSKENKLKIALNGCLNIMCTVSVILFLFTANCGINYYKSGISETMHIKTQPVSTEELYKVCVYLAQKASDARQGLSEDKNGIAKISGNLNERAKNYVNRLLNTSYSQPKNVFFSRAMSYLNITGVYFPFTFEANVNIDVPEFSIPATMCHELAHINGIMPEEDANFISFLACIGSHDNEFSYSGYTMAMIYASNALYRSDKEKYADFTRYMSDGLMRDLNAQSEYWKQFETPVAETASAINDTYLKSNSRSDGIRSYGNMVDLTVAYLKDKI